MSIKFLNSHINILNMTTRMPFKYGIATLTTLPHLFLKIEFEIDGEKSTGIASEGLAPKWFTKNPKTSFKEDIDEMILVIQKAVEFARETSSAKNVFEFWKSVYDKQKSWGDKNKLPGLLRSFGVSMVERALISSYCTAKEISFHKSIKQLGFQLNKIYPQLDHSLIDTAIPKVPKSTIEIRHTVGLADFLYDEDIPRSETVNDGLPESLESNVKTYGIKKLKIKVFGDLNKDIQRLLKISSIMDELSPDFSFSLDGNEFFKTANHFKDYWQELSETPSLNAFFQKLLFIEQPIHRDFALNSETAKCFQNWPERPDIIIDESDGELHSAEEALKIGYKGTSHKNCKGVFKSIANACLLKQYFGILSGEDLCNVGPIALQEDLAVAAALGISHVERNGHQYMRGLSMYPKSLQEQVLEFHNDLYKTHNRYPILNIKDGAVELASLNQAPFGVKGTIKTSNFTPIQDWSFSSLNI